MERVGVRELRQNASKLLERVQAGESIVITNHGREVAQLVPALRKANGREELIASGRLRPGSGGPWNVEPVRPAPGDPSNQDILDELRADRL